MIKKKLLIISYYYPPLATPRGTRWFYFSNFLARKGFDVDVISVTPIDLKYLDNKMKYNINETINVKRINQNIIIWPSRHKLKTENKSHSFINRLLDAIKRRIYYPDAQIVWALRVYRFLKEINVNKYDYVITVSNPLSSLIAGYLIRKKFNFTWICDMGDPWTFNPLIEYKKIRGKIDKILERKVIEKSDKIVVTTEQTKSSFSSLYPSSKDKFITVSQGYDPRLFKNAKESSFIDKKKLNIVYTGRLYSDKRDSTEFLYALKNLGSYLKDIKFLFAGIITKDFKKRVQKLGLEKNIDYLGYLPLDKTGDLQKSSDILLYLGNKSSTQLPCKIFEYIGAGKPILGIYYDNYDIGKQIIEEKSLGLTCINKREEIQTTLLKIIDLWRKRQLGKLRNKKNDYKCDWASTAEQFYNLLKD